MPSASRKPQRSKDARRSSSAAPTKPPRGAAGQSSAKSGAIHTGSSAVAGGPGGAESPGLEKSKPAGVPAPAAVLMDALGLLAEAKESADGGGGGGGGIATALTTSEGREDAVRHMEVELETTQGYVYVGKLVHIDAGYNMVLHEALVRRARAFDVERAALQEKARREARFIASSLRGTAPAPPAPEEQEEEGLEDGQLRGMPRPRYMGTVFMRSNNIFLLRFIDPAADAAATAASSNSALGRLRSRFAGMAAAIKAHLQREKLRRRAARRRRLEAKKKTVATSK
ncbi:hypothetical protein NESM_000433400 [Novymonas esmeraldas]|uniref:LSM domain-containing protein n=1 Tax=Novymonas esmeraldas TaxID=1808958 RepID=A0AAW0EPI7_9TRYP